MRVAAEIRELDRPTLCLRQGFQRFTALGCRFEQARCLELAGQAASARRTFERLAAEPSLARIG